MDSYSDQYYRILVDISGGKFAKWLRDQPQIPGLADTVRDMVRIVNELTDAVRYMDSMLKGMDEDGWYILHFFELDGSSLKIKDHVNESTSPVWWYLTATAIENVWFGLTRLPNYMDPIEKYFGRDLNELIF